MLFAWNVHVGIIKIYFIKVPKNKWDSKDFKTTVLVKKKHYTYYALPDINNIII